MVLHNQTNETFQDALHAYLDEVLSSRAAVAAADSREQAVKRASQGMSMRDALLSQMKMTNAQRVVQAFDGALRRYPDAVQVLFSLLTDWVESPGFDVAQHGDALFWMSLRAGEGVLPLPDLARHLSKVSSGNKLRSYLLFRLSLAEQPDDVMSAARAFYYAGHTVETLRAFQEAVTLAEHPHILVYLASSALSLVDAEQTEPDHGFLRRFFTDALDHTNDEQLAVSLRDALAKLK